MKLNILLFILLTVGISCSKSSQKDIPNPFNKATGPEGDALILLGTIQDGGSPHIGCKKDCCNDLFINPDNNRQIVSLGLLDHENNKRYLFEATPDMPRQIKALRYFGDSTDVEIPNGIFLTHAHIGHYTGLMFLGKEAMNATKAKVYAMPRMKNFLETSGPWSQLVNNQNINIQEIHQQETIQLSNNLTVTPILVPHRDEYSETVGFRIQGKSKSALFIPDIDKWEKWENDIMAEIKKVDYAFLDATFYSGKEINNRDISEIPHPFIIESVEKFKSLTQHEKNKIIFIHFNHTNPVIKINSPEAQSVISKGYRIAQINEVFHL